jgi:hypothetical protein
MPICITSKKEGFRRCGVDHPSTRTEHPDGTFTADQVKILQGEPMLVVELIPAGKSLNATDTIALVLAATTIDALDQMANGESRKGVLDAIAKRRLELTPAAAAAAAADTAPAAAAAPADAASAAAPAA